jgi:hypothetical protein
MSFAERVNRNATFQAFEGASCLTSNTTRMASSHLTDFMAAPAIHVSVASPAQLAPSASDLARLRFLITVLAVLFAAMCGAAYLLSVRDTFDGTVLLARILSPELGCRMVCADGSADTEEEPLWTWRFSQAPLENVVDGVRGSFVELAGLMGMPVVRLAAAIPEQWLHTSMQAATGRRDGLSATSFKEQYKMLKGARRHGLAAARPADAAAAPVDERCPTRVNASVEGTLMSRGGQVKMHATAPATDAQKDACVGDELAAALPVERQQQQQQQQQQHDVDGWSALPHCHTPVSMSISGADEMDAPDVLEESEQQEQQQQQSVDGWGTLPHHKGSSAPWTDSGVDDMDAPDVHEMVSTALAHAVMLGYCIASAGEVAEQQVAYMARLAAAGVDTDGRRYLHLFTAFKELIIPGMLGAGQSWLRNARLARIVLLSNPLGFWDADSGVAMSLLAHSHRIKPTKKQGIRLLLSYVQQLVTAAVSVLIGGVSMSSGASAADSVFKSRLRAHTGRLPRAGATVETRGEDCPLAFTGAAIAETVPPELAAAFVESSDTALRAWTTALVAELLLTLDANCWRVCANPRVDEDVPQTLVDAALRWLSVTLDGAPPELITDVRAAAREQVVVWAALHDEMITSSRNAHVPTRLHKHVLEQRACGAIFSAALTQHATVRLFTADVIFGGRRHQQFIVIVTLLIVALCASIWLYYSRALQCCLIVRAELGCSPDAFQPCRGYVSSCAELESTFFRFAYAAVHADSDVIVMPAPGLQCEAFPDPKYPLHTLVAGLISFACCVPAAWVLQACFSLSMATDDEQLHGRTRLMKWSLSKRLLFGAAPWSYQPGRAHRMRTRMASSWCATMPEQMTMRACDALGTLARRAGIKPDDDSDEANAVKIDTPLSPLSARREEEKDDDDVFTRDQRLCSAAARHDRVTENLKRAGFVLLAAAWAICLWMILVYGSLIYKLLGPDAEKTFTRSWGISVGLDQADQARSVIIVSAQTVAALLILEALYMSPNIAWLESMSDEASVAATLLRAGAVNLATRVRTYSRFNKAVV